MKKNIVWIFFLIPLLLLSINGYLLYVLLSLIFLSLVLFVSNYILKKPKSLITLSIFLTPTVVAAYIPISFTGKLTAGLVLFFAALVIVVYSIILNRNRCFSKLHISLICLFTLKIFYFLVFILQNDTSYAGYFPFLATFLTGQFSLFSYFIFYYFYDSDSKLLNKTSILFSTGSLITIIMAIMLFVVFSLVSGISGLQEARSSIYIQTREIKSTLVGQENLFSIPVIITKFMIAMGGTASIGPFLSFCFLFSFGNALFDKKRKRMYYFLVSILAFIGLVLMVSRSALLSSILVLFIFYIFYYNRILKKSNKVYQFIILTLLLFTLLFVLVPDEYNVLNRLSWEDIKNQPRLKLWWSAFKLIAVNPLGYGYDYIRGVKLLGDGTFPFGVDFEYNHLHNAYLAYFLNFGFIGFFILVSVLAISIKTGFNNVVKSYHYNTYFLPLSAGSLLAILGSSIHFIFSSMFLELEAIYGTSFWMMIAVIISIETKLHKGVEKD